MDIIDMNALVGISARPGGGLVGIHQTAHPVPDIRDLVKDIKNSIFSIYLSIFMEFLYKLIFLFINNLMETLLIQIFPLLCGIMLVSLLMWKLDYFRICVFIKTTLLSGYELSSLIIFIWNHTWIISRA